MKITLQALITASTIILTTIIITDKLMQIVQWLKLISRGITWKKVVADFASLTIGSLFIGNLISKMEESKWRIPGSSRKDTPWYSILVISSQLNAGSLQLLVCKLEKRSIWNALITMLMEELRGGVILEPRKLLHILISNSSLKFLNVKLR